jgi:hypothetical protein
MFLASLFCFVSATGIKGPDPRDTNTKK